MSCLFERLFVTLHVELTRCRGLLSADVLLAAVIHDAIRFIVGVIGASLMIVQAGLEVASLAEICLLGF